jgi:hypothetical protein
MSRRYENAKIYKLVSNKSADVYIGSCLITLARRLSTHRSDYNDCSSKRMFQVPDAIIQIVLIEALPNCKSKNEMKAKELHYMTVTPCININRPFVTDIQQVGGDDKEWKRAYHASPEIQEKKKEHYITNKPAILEKAKEYQVANAPAIASRKKEHYITNKPAILEKAKEYQVANAPAIAARRKEHYIANTPAIAARNKEYRAANRDKRNKRERERYAAKKLAKSTPAATLAETSPVSTDNSK